ncbi:MAG: hypothetical protein MI757_21825 [Pirellulales bacterium]|nr:hypothetical protein [Pirellulales bacterium]
MKRRKQSEIGSLDSLLDTMTNVVGILVIVLVVTQLGVRDAVSRISQSEQVSPEAIAAGRASLEKLTDERNQLEATAFSLSGDPKKDEMPRLEGRRNKLTSEIQQQNRRIEQERKNVASQLAETNRKATAAKKLNKELLESLEKAEKAVKVAEDMLAGLRAQLATIPLPTGKPAKVVTLPNPRSAPKGATPITVLCREGRVMLVDEANLQNNAQKRAKYLVDRRKLGTNKAKGIDGATLAKYFNQSPIRSPYFDIEMYIHANRYPRLRLTRRNNVGETAAQLRGSTSRFRQQIRRIPPGKHYLKFIVWPDSYEEYLLARQSATERGLMAGWTPTATAAEHTIPLGGPLRVGPPPKPKPVDPNAKPKPPPKPKPVDTID